MEILGIFPSFDSEKFGGIQGSGRDAWRSVLGRFGEAGAKALFYTPGESKAMAVVSAMRTPHARRILVWHLQLAKLLPLIAKPESRVSVFLHGIEAWRRLDRLSRAALRRVHVFLSNSDFTWSKFVESNPEFAATAHQTVHLGLGSSIGLQACPQCTAVLMVGRLRRTENYKGHREMIAAWPLVLRQIPFAELWIAGDGDLRPDLETLARKLRLQDHVRIHGHISELEKQRLIERCRCLALPSAGEGFGLVYLEAMRIGRPCLVSTLDAGREVVNPPEAGLAVNPAAPHEIAAAVARLLSPGPEWQQWSERARSRYAAHFTREHFERRLLAAIAD